MAWFFPTSRITREEHDEFRRRIEQEEERQNRRLELSVRCQSKNGTR